MEKLKLCNSDLEVSRICIGGDQMGGYGWGDVSQDELMLAVNKAIDLGINFFDTADIYGLGESEEFLGKVLGNRRKDVILATKFGVRKNNEGITFYDNSPAWIRQALSDSLRRLKTDYIDLYQLHYRDDITPIEDVIKTLEELKEGGKIRYYGLSNVFMKNYDELLPFKGKFVSFQDEYSLANRTNESDMELLANSLFMTPMTWGSLGQGILTGKYDSSVKFDENDRRSRLIYKNFHGEKLLKNLAIVDEMKKMALIYNKGISSIALRFILDYLPNSVVIVGIKNTSQLISNMESLDWTLAPKHLQILESISQDKYGGHKMLDLSKYKVPEKPLLINNNSLSDSDQIGLLKSMLTIRFAEERIAQRVKEKKIFTPCHLYIGQEAVAVGACRALKATDYVFSTHRSHGHFLAKGGDINSLFAEIYCRETGCSGGRGGSMHLCDPSKGLLGSSSIVGGGMGIGLGPALGSKIMKTEVVSVIFHGDSVPEEGIWHESLNFAAVKKLPVIFICENNLYAASLPLVGSRRIFDNIPEIAKGLGLPTSIIDGNDVLKVFDEVKNAVKRARSGEGPQFIECRTYRWLGHVGPNDDIDKGLRSQEELDFWKLRCPIAGLAKRLMDSRILSQEQLENIHKEIQGKIDDAEKFALNSKYPDPSTVLDNVFYSYEAAK